MAPEKVNFIMEQVKLSKPWENFFYKFKDIEEEPFKSKVFLWKEVHILAYICKRFKELYNKDYAITQKNAPSKCPDMFFVRKMISTLGTTNMVIVKEYIDWIYDKKIIPENKKIRTLSYFMTAGFVNEFYFQKSESEIVKRSTSLPKNYKEIANALNVSVDTYGDLAFIKMASDRAKGDLNNPNVVFFENIKALGFDISILEKLAE